MRNTISNIGTRSMREASIAYSENIYIYVYIYIYIYIYVYN